MAYYEGKGLLRRVDGWLEPDEVNDRIRALLRPCAWRKSSRKPRRALIIRKTQEQIERMVAAGAIQARCLRMLRSKCHPGITTAELDEAAQRFIDSQGAEASFKGYRGFPGSICTSPNSMVVHGIPGAYELKRGDIISLDVGVTKDGWVADAAITVPVGPVNPEARRLLDATRGALLAGAEQARPNNRLGDVSAAIQRQVELEGFSIIRSLVGHGIGRDMHEDPQIPNYGDPAGARDSSRAWCWRSSRWSTPAAPRSAWARTTGRSTPPMALWPPTSSSRSPSPRTVPASSPPGTRNRCDVVWPGSA